MDDTIDQAFADAASFGAGFWIETIDEEGQSKKISVSPLDVFYIKEISYRSCGGESVKLESGKMGKYQLVGWYKNAAISICGVLTPLRLVDYEYLTEAYNLSRQAAECGTIGMPIFIAMSDDHFIVYPVPDRDYELVDRHWPQRG